MPLYLLHWSPPLTGGRAPRHYLGWSTEDRLEERIANHLACGPRAAKIVVAAIAAGRQVQVAWIRLGDRADEAKLKRRKEGFVHLCPLCRTERAGRRLATEGKPGVDGLDAELQHARPKVKGAADTATPFDTSRHDECTTERGGETSSAPATADLLAATPTVRMSAVD